jgi:DNA primase catalytic core
MRVPPQFLDDIRARLPVSEVVAKRVQLKKQGREWRGLSPFNKEKTPSFYVNDQKGFYHDFSSGKHGDIFGFVMDTEGLTFPEAVERLAGIAGLPMPVMTREAVEQAEKRKTLHDVMELAAKFFQDQLAGRAGAHARGYLADRSLDAPTQQKFRIGYAPNERFALKEALGAQGIPVADMIETGLLIAGDDIPVPYDRFRDRVMFPITDIRGRVIAFGGRALQKDVPAKYLNSPETTLFHKGATLYNIAAARQAAHQGEPIVVAEGYVDVIALVGAGFRASVAPLGTAMTEDQLALMWKMADEPIICLDGDSAGRKAAYRAVDLAMPKLLAGKSLRFACLPARIPTISSAQVERRRCARSSATQCRSPRCCGFVKPSMAVSTRQSGGRRWKLGSALSSTRSPIKRCVNTTKTICPTASGRSSGRSNLAAWAAANSIANKTGAHRSAGSSKVIISAEGNNPSGREALESRHPWRQAPSSPAAGLSHALRCRRARRCFSSRH